MEGGVPGQVAEPAVQGAGGAAGATRGDRDTGGVAEPCLGQRYECRFRSLHRDCDKQDPRGARGFGGQSAVHRDTGAAGLPVYRSCAAAGTGAAGGGRASWDDRGGASGASSECRLPRRDGHSAGAVHAGDPGCAEPAGGAVGPAVPIAARVDRPGSDRQGSDRRIWFLASCGALLLAFTGWGAYRIGTAMRALPRPTLRRSRTTGISQPA